LNVLFAEDDALTAELYIGALEARGHRVIAAYDGQQCLNAYKRLTRPFDVVVLDYMLPIIDGGEIARQILEINEKQRIIIVTAYEKDLVTHFAPELKGKIQLIQKPFEPQQLVELIEGIKA